MVGCAFHAGVVSSLLHHLDWDARAAESIVGTSAGSLVGALLRGGVGPDDLARLTNPASTVARSALTADHIIEPVPTHGIARFLGDVRVPSPASVVRSLRNRSGRPAMLSITRSAGAPLDLVTADIARLVPAGWPSDDLRICTVSAVTGQRRVLDRWSGVPLPVAVAASCAVPGLFAPQVVAGDRLVDGGIHSATNVDTLPFDRLDEVWIVAPMAGRALRHPVAGLVPHLLRAQLRREVAAVPAGLRVRVFAPGLASGASMGLDLMATDRGARVFLDSFLETGDHVSGVSAA